MTTLDGEEREFDPEMALVCDAEGPSGIAGIMGGQVSEVSDKTTRVLMEAATWVGPNILQTSARLNLRSEASTRFEKQLHPELAMAAQRMTAKLMVELCGARLVPGTLDAYPEPPEPRRVHLRLERLASLTGEEIPRDEVVAILERLGFEVAEDLTVNVPFWRDSDVQREADLIEEAVRIYGLEKLPTTLPARERATGRLTPAQRLRRRLEDALRDRGMLEIVAWSFTSPETLARLRLGDAPALALANPLSEDQSVMRPLLLPGLLDAARHNGAHGRPEVALFESAHVYRPDPPDDSTPAYEPHHVGGLVRPGDFYAAKAYVEAALAALGIGWRAEPGEEPFLHPARAARVMAGDGVDVGWIGELHPLVARAWDLDAVAAFELNAGALAELAGPIHQYEELSPFPAVVQDIAVVVPEEATFAQVEGAVRAGAGEALERIELFDVYRGEQVGEGRKSLALRLEFRAHDRTLTDEDAAELRAAIERELEAIGGAIRA
jgi:phenylalanyl-tRNA synthetase beta chain